MFEIRNLKKTFYPGTVNARTALCGVDLTLEAGDFVTIIGGNGAGKSTLLNAICGSFPVDEGRILLDDTELTKLPQHVRARYLGRVFQDPMLGTAANMQIEENLAMAARRGKRRGLSWGIHERERKHYREALARLGLGLENRMQDKVGLLSGGQRQALTLLMATLVRPKLLLLDEHTAALDPATAATVLHLTRTLIENEKLSALMVTHNMQDAIDCGNRLIMMDRGRIIYDVAGPEKSALQVEDLLRRFQERTSGTLSDRMLLG